MRGKWGEILPILGHLIDLGFRIADRVRARRRKAGR